MLTNIKFNLKKQLILLFLYKSNIYLDLNYQIKIGDLSEASTTESIQKSFVGNLNFDFNYISPELFEKISLSPKIDIW